MQVRVLQLKQSTHHSLHQIAGIQKLVDDAVAKGARLLAGGKINPAYAQQTFYVPTLLVDVTTEMLIAQKEVWVLDIIVVSLICLQVFGPVMVIMKAEDDADALRIV
jgi:acyl-CoA reductase-like NAD-dependent aldehyde dehydrogenase